MKRLITSSENIFGIELPRNQALAKMSSISENINEHTIECVIYKKLKYLTVDHWVNELAVWMYRANKIKCNRKLKENDYIQTVFGAFGSDMIDADVNLDEYKRNNLKKSLQNQYPDFEITEYLIADLYDKYQKVIEASLPLLIDKEIFRIDIWKVVLLSIFK